VFASSEPGSSFACSLDDGSPSACVSPVTYAGLAPGEHRFRVVATDASGNVDPSPAAWLWTIVPPADTTAPDTAIDSGPTGTTTATSATFTFSADEAGARFDCALDGSSWAGCTSPRALDGLAAGSHAFAVRAIDTAGTADPTPAVWRWTVEEPRPPAPPAPPTPLAPPTPPAPPQPSGGGGAGGAAPNLVVQASVAPAMPAIGSTVTYVVTVRNVGGSAERAFVTVALPTQVTYAGSQADRGPGCTGSTTLSCDLDFLGSELVATVRVEAVVREAGTLVMSATASSRPADGQPANDSTTITTIVGSPQPVRPPLDAAPALRTVVRPQVTRQGRIATVVVRFSVSERARLRATIAAVGSRRPLTLLPGTLLAAMRSTKARTTATAAVASAGAYVFRARLASSRLVRGRTYLVRLVAIDGAGRSTPLTVRTRA
jgi:uncharacterized repeat protein (TIGR01451 family)